MDINVAFNKETRGTGVGVLPIQQILFKSQFEQDKFNYKTILKGSNKFLPKCWATSRMSLGDLPSTSREFKIGGRPSSNWTSTTAPITAIILPTASPPAGVVEVVFGAAAEAAAAADTGLSVET